jgi:SAM-dependent methyltransferase
MYVTKCPLCDSDKNTFVNSISTERLIEKWQKTLGIDVSDELNLIPKIDLLVCNDCQLRYFSPSDLVGSSHLYAQLEKFDWYYMQRKWEYDVAIDDLKGCQKILEIGCGFGNFVKQARIEHSLNMEGIEMNESAVQEAKSRGLPVRYLDLEDAAKKFAGQYEAVCSFQVIEHVSKPKDFLEWSCMLLKPGGKLILGIPNADSFLKYQFNILDMPPHHMTHWGRQVLSFLPDFFPLRLLHLKQEPLAEYHVVGYVDAYFFHLSKYKIIRTICKFRLKKAFVQFLKCKRLRKYLTGQTLYACFSRI